MVPASFARTVHDSGTGFHDRKRAARPNTGRGRREYQYNPCNSNHNHNHNWMIP
jgi:hypothetical protein